MAVAHQAQAQQGASAQLGEVPAPPIAAELGSPTSRVPASMAAARQGASPQASPSSPASPSRGGRERQGGHDTATVAVVDADGEDKILAKTRAELAAHRAQLVRLIHSWNEDESGTTVSRKELRKAARTLGVEVSGEHIDKLFGTWNADGSGELGIEQLAALLGDSSENTEAPDAATGFLQGILACFRASSLSGQAATIGGLVSVARSPGASNVFGHRSNLDSAFQEVLEVAGATVPEGRGSIFMALHEQRHRANELLAKIAAARDGLEPPEIALDFQSDGVERGAMLPTTMRREALSAFLVQLLEEDDEAVIDRPAVSNTLLIMVAEGARPYSSLSGVKGGGSRRAARPRAALATRRLSKAEFQEALMGLGYGDDAEDIWWKMLFRDIDVDADGFVSVQDLTRSFAVSEIQRPW